MTNKEVSKRYYENNKERLKEHSKKYYQDNKQFVLLKQKLYRDTNKIKMVSKSRKQNLKYNYGLSTEDYNLLFMNQNGRCAICDKHQSELQRNLHVDHNHITGEIRGLLCPTCNTGLGRFETWYQEHQQQVTDYLSGHKRK